MADRTILISNLPAGTTEEQIRDALGGPSTTRISINASSAYVQLENADDIEVLEFSAYENKLDKLNGAVFQRASPDFQWAAAAVTEGKEEHEKVENLTDPSPDNLFTISNCDVSILAGMTEDQIKSTIFSGFSSVNRVLKRENSLTVELQNSAETEKLQGLFPGLRVPILGQNAYVNLEAENIEGFAKQWINQHHKQTEIKSDGSDNHKASQQSAKKEEQGEKKYLHEEIIPKLNKLTSMETDFLMSQGQNPNILNEHEVIGEQTEEHITTNLKIQSDKQEFMLQEESQTASSQEQEARRREAEENERREQQLRKEKEQQERREHECKLEQERIEKEEKARKEEEERIRREQEERLRRELEERARRAQQQKARAEQEEKIRREYEQKARRQSEEKIKREQEEKVRREHSENIQRQRQQNESAERNRKQQEQRAAQEELRRQQQEQLRQRKQRQVEAEQQRQRIAAEAEATARKLKQQSQRIVRQQAARIAEPLYEVRESLLQTKQNVVQFITGAAPQKLSNLVQAEAGSPVAFWTIVMVSVLVMLLI